METGRELRKRREGETCADCRFYVAETADGEDVGYCRRYPPIWEARGDDSVYGFPKTLAHLWCGEWKSNNELG